MILYLQITLILILAFTLIALYFDEKQKTKIRAPKAKLIHAWEGGERRNFIRFDIDVPIRYKMAKTPANGKALKVKNISAGGIAVTLNEKLNPHDSLFLEIDLPGANVPVLANCEVVWVKEDINRQNPGGIRCFDVGIEFKVLSARDKDKLFKFIKESGKI